MGQHVFLDHIGQGVGGLLAALGDAVQALGQRFHDPAHGGHDEGHGQGQLPVQVQQIAQQRHQGEAVARDGQKGLDQLRGPGLHLVHHGVGQCTGRLLGKQVHLRDLDAGEQVFAQAQHAFVGNPRERILARELRHATHQEQSDNE